MTERETKITDKTYYDIPISADLYLYIKRSWDQAYYDNLIAGALSADRTLTVGRVVACIETACSDDPTTSKPGKHNEGMHSHMEASIIFYIFLGIQSLFCMYLAEKTRKIKLVKTQNIRRAIAEHETREQDRMRDLAEAYASSISAVVDDGKKNIQQALGAESINEYIAKIFKQNASLSERYGAIQIVEKQDKDKTLVLRLIPKSKPVATKVRQEGESFISYWIVRRAIQPLRAGFNSIWRNTVKPFYKSGGLAAFMFWLIWIGAAATTGMLGGNTTLIEGMVNWLVIAIPALIGGTWLLLYAGNAIKNGGAKGIEQKEQAQADADNILQKALAVLEYERVQERTREQRIYLMAAALNYPKLKYQTASTSCDSKEVLLTPGGGAKKIFAKSLVTFAAVAPANWVSSQAFAWYNVKVLVEFFAAVTLTAASVSGPIGWALLGVAMFFGLLTAGKRFVVGMKDRNEHKEKIKDKLHDVFTQKDFNEKMKEYNGEINSVVQLNALLSHKSVLTLEVADELYKKGKEHLKRLRAEMREYRDEQVRFKRTDNMHYIAMPPMFDKTQYEPPAPKTFMEKVVARCMGIRNSKKVDNFDTFLQVGVFLGRMLFSCAVIFAFGALGTGLVLSGPGAIAAIFGVALVYCAIQYSNKKLQHADARRKEYPDRFKKLVEKIELAEEVCNNMQLSKVVLSATVVTPTTMRDAASQSESEKDPLLSPAAPSSDMEPPSPKTRSSSCFGWMARKSSANKVAANTEVTAAPTPSR